MGELLSWEPSVDVSLVTPNGHTFAVFVCGLQTRLAFVSKLTHVIEPAVARGYTVVVYMELTKAGFESGSWNAPPSSLSTSPYANMPDFHSVLRQKIHAAGAHLEILDHREGSDTAAIRAFLKRGRKARFPSLNHDSPFDPLIGVMRRVLPLQRLWRSARKQDPSFVLVTRDDNYWLGPLNLDLFLHRSNYRESVYSKNCTSQEGIDDSTLLFGGSALRQMSKLFWDTVIASQIRNTDTFWRSYVRLYNVSSAPVSFRFLPTADAVYQVADGARTQCLREYRPCAHGNFEAEDPIPPTCVEDSGSFEYQLNSTGPFFVGRPFSSGEEYR